MPKEKLPTGETPFPQERFYGHFNPLERHDIYQFTKALTEYLENNKIENIVFVDVGARPAWVGVHEYWKEHFPDKDLPGLYFINPETISGTEKDALRKKLYDRMTHVRYMDEIDETWPARPTDTAGPQEEFRNTFTALMHDTDKPVVIFDTCSHTGGTLSPIVAMLKELGFKDVRVLTANRPNLVSPITTAAHLDNQIILEGVCNPFGRDPLVKKGGGIVSERADDAPRKKGVRIRREIRQIIRDKGE